MSPQVLAMVQYLSWNVVQKRCSVLLTIRESTESTASTTTASRATIRNK